MCTRVEEVIEEALECFDILNTAHTQSIDQLESRECGVSRVTNGRGKCSILNLIYSSYRIHINQK